MYGYVVPPVSSLSKEDYALFNSFYCGLCVETGKLMGQRARLTTNYDITFMNVILHDLLRQEVTFKVKKCAYNAFRKRPVVEKNRLLSKIAAVNVILSYHKAIDGVIDGEGIKYKVATSSLKKAYELSRSMMPRVDEIVSKSYKALRKMEKESVKGVDQVSDVFASMMSDVAAEILKDKATDDSLKLFYNIGKLVYMLDALDDIDEDHKAKRYNPFLAVLPYENRAKFFEDNREYLEFMLNITANRAIECFNNLSFLQSYDLLKKIVHIGLRQKIKELLSSKKKLARPRV